MFELNDTVIYIGREHPVAGFFCKILAIEVNQSLFLQVTDKFSPGYKFYATFDDVLLASKHKPKCSIEGHPYTKIFK